MCVSVVIFQPLTFCLSCRTDILIWRKSSHVAEQVPAFITLSDFSKRCTAGNLKKRKKSFCDKSSQKKFCTEVEKKHNQ